MNRRDFLQLAAGAAALAVVPPLAATPFVEYFPYCDFKDELRMDLISLNRGQHVGFRTIYGANPPDPKSAPGAVTLEWFKTPDDIAWARRVFPEAFGVSS